MACQSCTAARTSASTCRIVGGQGRPVGCADDAVAFDHDERGDLAGRSRFRLPVGPRDVDDLAVLATQHLQQWVHDPVCRSPAAVDSHGDGVHQERHVLLDDLQYRVVAHEAVFRQRRIEYPHLRRLLRPCTRQQPPVGGSHCEQCRRSPGHDFGRVDAVEIGCHEVAHAFAMGPAVGACIRDEFVDCAWAHAVSITCVAVRF
jgi:hypothetical protein